MRARLLLGLRRWLGRRLLRHRRCRAGDRSRRRVTIGSLAVSVRGNAGSRRRGSEQRNAPRGDLVLGAMTISVRATGYGGPEV